MKQNTAKQLISFLIMFPLLGSFYHLLVFFGVSDPWIVSLLCGVAFEGVSFASLYWVTSKKDIVANRVLWIAIIATIMFQLYGNIYYYVNLSGTQEHIANAIVKGSILPLLVALLSYVQGRIEAIQETKEVKEIKKVYDGTVLKVSEQETVQISPLVSLETKRNSLMKPKRNRDLPKETLEIIKGNPKISQIEIANTLQVSKGYMSKVINGLIKNGQLLQENGEWKVPINNWNVEDYKEHE